MHALKLTCLLSWLALLALQIALPWYVGSYWLLLLAAPLLVPLKGLLADRRYTYRWIGFLTMLYFCIGIGELVANPGLRLYGLGTTVASTLLFLGSIYYARYLGLRDRN